MGSAKRTVVVMPGDGIGSVVVPEAVRVLEAAGFDATFVTAEIGWPAGQDGDERPVNDRAAGFREHQRGRWATIMPSPPPRGESQLRLGSRAGAEVREHDPDR